MSNDLPVPPKVDLNFAFQFVGQLYGAIASIEAEGRALAEKKSLGEKLDADNERRRQDGQGLNAENAKLRGERQQLLDESARLRQENETLRSEVGSQQAQLVAIKGQFAEIEAALPRRR